MKDEYIIEENLINLSFRDGRLALGDELVNISGKRFHLIFITNCPPPPHATDFQDFGAHLTIFIVIVTAHFQFSIRLRGLPKEKAATIIAEAGRFVPIFLKQI